VTGLSSHNGQGAIDFGHLFLTSSIDWTVKLWSLKDNRPLYSFEDNGDYVFDVAWSPVHPALFAAVDGNGRLDLWNLVRSFFMLTKSVFYNFIFLEQRHRGIYSLSGCWCPNRRRSIGYLCCAKSRLLDPIGPPRYCG
jgi:WD40 repeat protein